MTREDLDFQVLLAEALRCGLSTLEFWDLTPRETVMACQAAMWRMEQAQEQALSLAWHMAALTRAKRIPPLARLLARLRRASEPEPPIEDRRAEFEELKQRMVKRRD